MFIESPGHYRLKSVRLGRWQPVRKEGAALPQKAACFGSRRSLSRKERSYRAPGATNRCRRPWIIGMAVRFHLNMSAGLLFSRPENEAAGPSPEQRSC